MRKHFPSSLCALLVAPIGALLLAPSIADAQELEPRAYSNAPVGFNFLVGAYAFSKGGLATDPSLPIEDAHLKLDAVILAYARSLDLWGHSGRFDAILPYAQVSGSALFAGEPIERRVEGLGDPRFRLSMNFYGAPALPIKEFMTYRQDLVIGASVQVTAPGTQYDSSRIVNLGTNRWSVKTDLGFSKALDGWTIDFTGNVTFFTNNTDFYGGKTVERRPLYALQSNLSYNFSGGAWAALGATVYSGGRTTVDGVRKADMLNNSRTGLTVSLPIDRYNSIKFNASSGVTTRIGTSFKTIGIAWQTRWADGF